MAALEYDAGRAADPERRGYHSLPAARAKLLALLGRPAEAAQAYRAALELISNKPGAST